MLEDNPLDAAVIQKVISKISYEIQVTLTGSADEYMEQLNKNEYDLILSDYQLPNFDAVKALKARNQKNSSIPFILITGAVSEEVATLVLREGADDYILKDRMQRLPFAIERIIYKQRMKLDKQFLETSLSEITERFQLAAKASFDVIWDYDIEKGRIYCSHAIERIIGIGAKENFKPGYLKAFIHPNDLANLENSFIITIKGKENRWRKIFRVVRKDDSIAWVNVNALVLRNKKEKAIRVTGVLHDVTEVRYLQHQLVEQELQIQKKITETAIQAQEKERTEIGKELHDNVNQLLATAKIMIDTAKNIPEMRDVCLTKSQESIVEAISELRNLAHSMMPPSFERSDFKSIVADLVDKIHLTGKLHIDLAIPSPEKLRLMNNNIKLCFYRIIQEQVSNILKHSKAKEAVIFIDGNEHNFILAIEDDGIGFNPSANPKGIGLKNMENRCNLLGGSLEIVTAPSEGCMLKVQIPVKKELYA
jgi:two-component system sensor histidine kinase UhpB